ncbi:unnamed protein product [Nesidiocoris tenuis]|uniref:Uncharacterized protein n=1 Tax=Nesidiocoris tenuis TaxID=355587 RepID=A0A6H5HDD0_9HEMI|nr:unnamed protein product [Nesidiocoris tenuis]
MQPYWISTSLMCSEGIWCFQCNSQHDPSCAHLQPNDTTSPFYRQCRDDDQSEKHKGPKEFFCRKIVQKIFDRDGLERVVRRCGWVPHPRLECYQFKNVGHEDTVCQCFTDACNSAHRSIAGKSTVIAVSLLSAALALRSLN